MIMVLALLLIGITLASCTGSFPTKEKVASLTDEEATGLLKGKTEQEIHKEWGTPDGMFSGFYGDIYTCNDKNIGIYYDADSKVTDVRIWNKEK